jgi:hypothetical protein
MHFLLLFIDKKSVFARYKKPLLNLFLIVNDLSKFFIGAGKFSSMFLAQSRLVPGMVITGIADLSQINLGH